MTHTKDEALKLAIQSLESCSGVPHWPAICATIVTIKQALAAPVQEPVAQEPLTDGYVQLVPDKCDRIVWRTRYFHLPIANTPPAAQPAVPDALTSADIQEHIEYVAGWNECRQAMLEMTKNRSN
jgi:hypothetical protein